MTTDTEARPIPKIEMPDPSCSNCKWGKKAKQGPHYECHRFPPQVSSFPIPVQGPSPRIGMPGMVQMQIQHATVFPTVQSRGLCGEHQPSFGRAH